MYTFQVQLVSEDGLNPLGKYTANGPTVVPSALATGRMCTTSGRSARFRFTMIFRTLQAALVCTGVKLCLGRHRLLRALQSCCYQQALQLQCRLRNQLNKCLQPHMGSAALDSLHSTTLAYLSFVQSLTARSRCNSFILRHAVLCLPVPYCVLSSRTAFLCAMQHVML